MFNFSKFFLEKWIFWEEKCWHFEKWIHFQILWIVLQNETSLPSCGLRFRTPCGGRLIALKWPGRSSPKNSWRRHCKFLNQIIELTENFSGFIGLIKFENFQIIIRKNSEIPIKYVRFFEIFLMKNRFFGQENVDIFENSIHFLILCIVLKNETSLPSGGLRPPDPLRGARDSL